MTGYIAEEVQLCRKSSIMLSRIPGNFSLLWRCPVKTGASSEQSESVRHRDRKIQGTKKIEDESLFAICKASIF